MVIKAILGIVLVVTMGAWCFAMLPEFSLKHKCLDLNFPPYRSCYWPNPVGGNRPVQIALAGAVVAESLILVLTSERELATITG